MEQDRIPSQPNNSQPGVPAYQQHNFPQGPQNYGNLPAQYPEESQAVLSLVMSIIGLVACSGLLCPVGWYYGKQELDGIDAGRRDPSKRDMAKAGHIIGILGTTLLILAIVAVIGFVLIALLFGSAA